MLIKWLTLFLAISTWAQGFVDSPRLPEEIDTQQLGGVVNGRLVLDISTSSLGVLRCRGGEAFVGLKMARAAAIDFLQIGCAPVQCANGNCTWSGSPWGGPAVGNPHGGGGGLVSVDLSIDQTCPQNSVVTGFQGATTLRGTYAYDLQLKCSPMAGRPPAAYINGITVTPVRAVTPTDARRRDPATGLPIPLRESMLSVSCQSSGATALSYAIGRYGLGIPVVQAVSLYCVSGSTDCPAGDPSLRPLAQQLITDGNTLRDMAEVATDHFILGVSDTVIGTLNWLATPCENGGALGATAQQFLQFLALPDAQRNNVLLKAATDGLTLFQNDPARFFGQQASTLR